MSFLTTCFPGGYRLRAYAGSNFYPFPPILARPLARWLPSLAVGSFFRLQKVHPYQAEFMQYLAQNRLQTAFFTGPYESSLPI